MRNYRHFTDEDVEFIREHYLSMTYGQLALAMGRSQRAVGWKVQHLKLPSKMQVILARKKTDSYRCYSSWSSMLTRCFNPDRESWINYGGRGITVCERWLKFSNFLEDMGEKPEGHSIDRIDPNGNYEPSNCRWIPINEQGRTTRKWFANAVCMDCGCGRGNRKGRCHKCNEYFRRNGFSRPTCVNAVITRSTNAKTAQGGRT